MAQPQTRSTTETTVDVRATGHVRDLVIAETEADSTTRGWAPIDAADVPGHLRKNPDGEQTRAYARILINGQFNENLDGFDTKLKDGDRVALVYPFLFCL